MNNTVITQEKLTNLKDLVSRIEKLEIDLKCIKNKYIDSVFKAYIFTEEDIKKEKRYKKVKKEYQKRINEIIKTL